MLGRIVNLVPTVIFISMENYLGYFTLLGLLILSAIPFLVYGKRVVDEG